MEIPPFPNSVNAPLYRPKQINDAYRIDSFSRVSLVQSLVQKEAVSRYFEFVYEFRNGEVQTSIPKVFRQDIVDLKA